MNGDFAFEDLKEGTYSLIAEATHFKKLVVKQINVTDQRVTHLKLIVEVSGDSVMVGVVGETPLIDMRPSSVTTTITRRQIDGLPRH